MKTARDAEFFFGVRWLGTAFFFPPTPGGGSGMRGYAWSFVLAGMTVGGLYFRTASTSRD